MKTPQKLADKIWDAVECDVWFELRLKADERGVGMDTIINEFKEKIIRVLERNK